MNRSILTVTLVLVVLLSACGSTQVPTTTVVVVGEPMPVTGGSYTDIKVSELQSMLANKDFTLVNVHTPFDGNIAHTDLSIPYDQVAQHLEQLPDKDARIVLYCRSGRMSSIAAGALVSLGYTHIFSLVGGMAAWEQAGESIQR